MERRKVISIGVDILLTDDSRLAVKISNNINEASINQRLTTSMKATNVTKIQIRLFVEESQQLETSVKKKILIYRK